VRFDTWRGPLDLPAAGLFLSAKQLNGYNSLKRPITQARLLEFRSFDVGQRLPEKWLFGKILLPQ